MFVGDDAYIVPAEHTVFTKDYGKFAIFRGPMWTGALRKRGQLDKLPELEQFADRLETACMDTLKAGIMTKDLVGLVEDGPAQAVTSLAFLQAIRSRMVA